MAGKGDTPRPVDPKKWSENWDKIFGKGCTFSKKGDNAKDLNKEALSCKKSGKTL